MIKQLLLEVFYILFERQFPVGVLYDLYSDSLLKLVVHLTNFPERELIRLGNEMSLKKYFMNELKQVNKIK